MATYLCWCPDLGETADGAAVVTALDPANAAHEYAAAFRAAVATLADVVVDVQTPTGETLTFDVDCDGRATGRMGGDE